jgi:hypothetical protein
MKKIIILSCIMLLLCSGCALFQRQSTLDSAPQQKQEGPNQVFYGFSDVPTPRELSIISDRTFVYETSALKAGKLFLNGNVDLQSLENYYRVNMPKNGWRYVNSFRFKDTIMNYVKDDRICNIRMSRGAVSSDLEIWVGPAEKGSIQKSSEPSFR